MKKIVIALNDYQHGGVGLLIRCDDIEGLSHRLGADWEVVHQQVEEHPFYRFAIERGYEVYDYPNATGLLAKIIHDANGGR